MVQIKMDHSDSSTVIYIVVTRTVMLLPVFVFGLEEIVVVLNAHLFSARTGRVWVSSLIFIMGQN